MQQPACARGKLRHSPTLLLLPIHGHFRGVARSSLPLGDVPFAQVALRGMQQGEMSALPGPAKLPFK